MDRVIIAPAPLAGIPGPYVDVLTRAGFDVFYPRQKKTLTEADMVEQLRGLRAVVAGSEKYTARVLDALPELRIVSRVGVGYDAVDVAACTERGIAVAYAPGANNEAVAEQTLMAILVLAKSLMHQDREIRAGNWPRQGYQPVRGATLGIVGLGRVGKAVVRRAKPFRMEVLATDPVVDGEFNREYGVTMVPFEELLARSDFVSLHVPGLPTTRHLIRAETLKLMKPTVYVINTARGTAVNEADLVAALEAKAIAGAALDVFEPEPPPAGHALYKYPNVLLTAHTAGVDRQALQDLALSAANSIVAIARGEWPLEQIVNPEVRERFRW